MRATGGAERPQLLRGPDRDPGTFAQYIPTFGLIAGSNDQSIATFPDDLASGLQHLLNEKVAPGHFTVTRRSGVYAGGEVDKALRAGNPIILLVDGGNHYQVVTGTGTGGAFVIDYPGKDTWRSWTSLGIDLPWYSDIFSTVASAPEATRTTPSSR